MKPEVSWSPGLVSGGGRGEQSRAACRGRTGSEAHSWASCLSSSGGGSRTDCPAESEERCKRQAVDGREGGRALQ